jgi:hypothetical protein
MVVDSARGCPIANTRSILREGGKGIAGEMAESFDGGGRQMVFKLSVVIST